MKGDKAMKKIIINAQYCNSLSCLFQTLTDAALSWNHFNSDNTVIFLKTAQKEKSSIEYAKKTRDAINWSPSLCVKLLIDSAKKTTSYIKKNPLPWYLVEFYDYGIKELKSFIKDVKLLNIKNSNFTGKIYGSQY